MNSSVSIVLPVRNAGGTLHRAIDSVLSQTHKEFELLCVINGSSDDSEIIAESYSRDDSRVRVLHSKPGLVPALNEGLRMSRHDIIARQDSDDFWYPSKLEKQLDYLERNPEVHILGSQMRSVGEDGVPTKQEPPRPTKDSEIKSALLSGWNCIPHPGVIFKREILERLGGYDDTFPFAEDYSLWLRAMQWYNFAQLEDVLLDYTSKHNPRYDHRVPQFLSSVYRALYGVQ